MNSCIFPASLTVGGLLVPPHLIITDWATNGAAINSGCAVSQVNAALFDGTLPVLDSTFSASQTYYPVGAVRTGAGLSDDAFNLNGVNSDTLGIFLVRKSPDWWLNFWCNTAPFPLLWSGKLENSLGSVGKYVFTSPNWSGDIPLLLAPASLTTAELTPYCPADSGPPASIGGGLPARVRIKNYATLFQPYLGNTLSGNPSANPAWDGTFPNFDGISKWTPNANLSVNGVALSITSEVNFFGGTEWKTVLIANGAVGHEIWGGSKTVNATPVGAYQRSDTTDGVGPDCLTIESY